ncbi:protein transporter SEC24 [Vararia minispora EC-137]|uniref:Protein transporter SEC24 n=1 Tax=Vararia minispora EC-137 TaxID=1314806 RepID=A0ACB8QMH5_9AGAM|nr:protein transporter SEC24 [Vararia minispora EC-137]
MAEQQQLPAGWVAEWNAEYQRHLFIEQATGHTQWEPPAQKIPAVQSSASSTSPLPTSHHSKRRQYAAGQTQAYYGGFDALSTPQPLQVPQGSGNKLFTPGLTLENQFATQQQQQQQPSPYVQQPGSEYINTAGYGYDHASGYPIQVSQTMPADQLAGQFGQMGFGQKPRLTTANLLVAPPDPSELSLPPPEITLPQGASLSCSPHVNAPSSYQRCTVNAFPNTSSLASKSKIPLALVINPYKSLKGGEEPVPFVSDTIIARCRRCRTYINPYVQFIDNNNRWRCCMCSMSNEVPQAFDWDVINNRPVDRWARVELNHGVVEFVAPTEYMVRPPQPVVYVFLIDVSHTAVQSGMVTTAACTILENLDRLPNGDQRTKVAFIGFDSSLYFFSMPSKAADANMLVMSDVDDVFLPQPADLLVNLTAARTSIETLLGRLPEMFRENRSVGNALGPALQAGFKLATPIGGKIIALTGSLPSVGPGALKARDDPKVYGTPKESVLLQPASSFYKTFAIDCSRSQVTVDMFLFSQTYQDVATLSCLPHYTSGQTYFYPAFDAACIEDAVKFAHEFGKVLAMPIMLEAVTRVRASRGLRMSSFHGNFFVRSTDLLAMPTVPQDTGYTIEIQIEETVTQPFVVLQTAVLHTTCYGERRIRIITTALPTTSNLSDLFASVDQVAIATLLANKAVERSLTHRLEDARESLVGKLVEILQAYKSSMTAGTSVQLVIGDNMRLLPLLVLGLLKSVGIRQSSQVPADLRAYGQILLMSLPSESLVPYIHPNFYSLHNMPQECGTTGEYGVILPPPLSLSSEHFERHGLYLIEDGQVIFLWVGREAVPQLLLDVFNLPNYETLRGGKATLPLLDNPFSQRVRAIIQKTREMRYGVHYPHVYVVKEDGEPSLRLWALSALVQDSAHILPSYQQFIGQLKDKVSGNGY